jgi:hypothetical protein
MAVGLAGLDHFGWMFVVMPNQVAKMADSEGVVTDY